MSDPTNHHWLPQFITRRWRGDDGLVNRFFRPHSKIISSRKSTKSLGANKDLYTLQWKRVNDPYELEKDVFTKAIDTPASLIAGKILEGKIDGLSYIERKTFAQFIIMLWLRVRERFTENDTEDFPNFCWFKRTFREIDGPIKNASDEEFQQFYNAHFAGSNKHLRVLAMLEFATDPALTNRLTALEWSLVYTEQCGLDYVIGDRPVQLWGNNGAIDRVFLPLSPNALFVAAEPSWYNSEIKLQEDFRMIFVLEVNRKQFQDADDFVISKDLGPNDGYLKIAEMYLKEPQEPS